MNTKFLLMKYIVFFAFMLLFCSGLSGSAKNDSINLFSVNDIVFHSELESQGWQCVKERTECNHFLMALATDPRMGWADYESYSRDFYQFLEQLKSDKRFVRKPKRQIKFLFEAIHDQYFRLYRDNPHFSEIFTNGNFNCLTASALYAMAFEYLEIPYEIILLTHHVYLVAYPEQSSIIVETTHALSGVNLLIDSREKTKAVQSLVDMKIITQEEIIQKGIDRIFSETYLSNDRPDLLQLVGSIYNNLAVDYSERLEYVNAYESFKRSSILYPRKLTNAMLITSNLMSLGQNTFTNPYMYKLITEMERFTIFNIQPQMVIEQSNSMILQAFMEGDHAMMDSAFVWMYHGFSNQNIKDEISFTYHYNKGAYLFNQYLREEALQFLDAAYQIKPREINLQNLLLEILRLQLSNSHTPIDRYRIVNEYSERFELLNENNKIMVFRQMAMLDLMNYYFSRREFAHAEKTREEFENQFKPGEVNAFEVINFLEETYSRASLNYFRVNRKNNARSILNSGLLYLPDSYDLKSKLNALR